MTEDAPNSLTDSVLFLKQHGPEELIKVLEDELGLHGPKIMAKTMVELIEAHDQNLRLLDGILLHVSALDIEVVNNSVTGRVFSDEVYIDATQAFSPAQGLLQLETSTDGTPYRWTGGNDGSSVFSIHIDRSVDRKLKLSFMCADSVRDQMEKHQFYAFINGSQIKFEAEFADQIVHFSSTLPHLNDNTLTQLILRIPTWKPGERDGSKDARILGWPFVSLTAK